MIFECKQQPEEQNCEKQSNIEKVELAISNLEAKLNYEKIINNFKTFSDHPEKINLQQIWKTINKLWPKVENKLQQQTANFMRNKDLSIYLYTVSIPPTRRVAGIQSF